MEKHDVAIIGGGIAGLTLAKFLAEYGIPFVLIEEHEDFFKKPCGEMIIPMLAGYSFHDLCGYGIERKFNEVCIHTKHGDIKANLPTILLDRLEMEKELAKRAEKGGKILMGRRAKYIENGVIYPQEIKANIIVGADGVFSIVRKYIGLPPLPAGMAAMTYVENVEMDDSCPHIVIGKDIVKHGYSWYFPKKDRWNIGVGSFKKNEFMKSFIKFRDKGKNWKSWPLPTGKITGAYGKNAILIGDAAGQVIAAAGAGIMPSIIASMLAAEFIKKFMEGKTSLKEYEKKWKKELGKQFRYAYIASFLFWKVIKSDYARYVILKKIGRNAKRFYRGLQK